MPCIRLRGRDAERFRRNSSAGGSAGIFAARRRWLPLLASFLALLLLQPQTVRALDLEWTKYSDAADLPMSTQWREDMKAKMSRIDTTKLNPRQKMQYKTLWRKLNGVSRDDDSGFGELISSGLPWLLLGAAGLLYYFYTNAESTPGPAATLRAAPPGEVGAPVNDAARAARLRRFNDQQAQTIGRDD
eukprot:TRINITY_DN23008_c0_g1_i2.p1 TRINITY_DN23008_c0_g1~~TRINITY_DN23008_c0_g1_i2.p1  ORF type:complete len:188 (+),score=47.83 TRINITY_DN23008_c0_g1_i2:105-668(+)